MNLKLGRLIPTFALLFFALGCGARSPLDMLDDESAASMGGIGGNLGKGGSSGQLASGGRPGAGGVAGYPPAKGGSPSSGGYYYSTGGYYYSTGGYYYGTGGYYYGTGGAYTSGGYYYGTGGYYSSGGYYYGTGGYSLSVGGSPLGGRGGTAGSSLGGTGGRGGTVSAGGFPFAGGSTAYVRGDGGLGGGGGGGGSIMVDAYLSRDLLPDRMGDGISTGDAAKLDGSVTPDASTCPGLASNEELIDDLNDGDRFIPLVNGRVGAWTDYHDASPSGKMFPDPSTGFVPTDTGDSCRKFAAYVVGTGYVLLGSGFWFGLGSPYNASKYTGISFWAKIDAGTSPVLRVSFPDKDTQPDGNICQPGTCYDHYGYRVTLTTTWTKYTVPFSLLKQEGWGHAGTAFDPSTIYQVAFAIPVNATFGIWIDDVAFTM